MFGLSLSPWILLGALSSVVASFAGGYFKGDADAADRYQTKIATMQVEAQDRTQKARDALMAQANAAVTTLESQNAKASIVYRTITQTVDKIVDRPVYRNVCLDDDGLRLVNAALGGVPAAPADPGNADSGMPRALAPQ